MKTEEFFDAVYSGRMSDLDIYNTVQEITDNFDEIKLNMLCNDFDFYLSMAKENWLASVQDEVHKKIKEYDEAGKEIPMMIDKTNVMPDLISGYFKTPEHKKIKNKRELNENQKREIEDFLNQVDENRKRTVDVEKLMDSHGFEFFNLYKLRNLLVDLKRKHTSAEYKFDDKTGSSFNPFENIKNKSDSETIKFFDAVNSGSYSKLDIHNKIQELTDNYDEDKLTLLCDEFDLYIFVKYENWRASYSEDDVHKKIDKYHDKGIKLPIKGDEKHKYQLPFIRNFFFIKRYGKPVSDEEFEKYLFGKDRKKHDVIDDNVLLGGFYFDNDSNNLMNLRDILVNLKRKHTSSVYRFDDKPEDIKANNKHISWLKSDESLEQFIEALKEHNLIKSRETEAIIKGHFEPHREQSNKPEPIEWLETIALLAYMIESLDQYYIKPKNIWSDTAPHFSVKGKTPENLRQNVTRYKNVNKSGKPKNYEIIDSIIQSLPE